MNPDYYARYPCSNELYHHGILGQKWGVRRFQNADGSLTPEGRIRYGKGSEIGKKANAIAKRVAKGASEAGKYVGKKAKQAGEYAVKRAKMRFPSFMTDEELAEYTSRIASEKRYKDARREMVSNGAAASAKKFIGDVLTNGAQTLARKGFDKLAAELTKTPLERQEEQLKRLANIKDYQEKLSNVKKESARSFIDRVLNDPNATAKDIADAASISENLKKLGKKDQPDKPNKPNKTNEGAEAPQQVEPETPKPPKKSENAKDDGSWIASNNSQTIRNTNPFSNYRMRPLPDDSPKNVRSSDPFPDSPFLRGKSLIYEVVEDSADVPAKLISRDEITEKGKLFLEDDDVWDAPRYGSGLVSYDEDWFDYDN